MNFKFVVQFKFNSPVWSDKLLYEKQLSISIYKMQNGHCQKTVTLSELYFIDIIMDSLPITVYYLWNPVQI